MSPPPPLPPPSAPKEGRRRPAIESCGRPYSEGVGGEHCIHFPFHKKPYEIVSYCSIYYRCLRMQPKEGRASDPTITAYIWQDEVKR